MNLIISFKTVSRFGINLIIGHKNLNVKVFTVSRLHHQKSQIARVRCKNDSFFRYFFCKVVFFHFNFSSIDNYIWDETPYLLAVSLVLMVGTSYLQIFHFNQLFCFDYDTIKLTRPSTVLTPVHIRSKKFGHLWPHV